MRARDQATVICRLLVVGRAQAAVPVVEVLLVRALAALAPEPALDLALARGRVPVHDRAAEIWPGRDRVQVVRALVHVPAVFQRIAICRISSTCRLAVARAALVHRLDLEWVRPRALPAARLLEVRPRSF
jgi:hypothetical protein